MNVRKKYAIITFCLFAFFAQAQEEQIIKKDFEIGGNFFSYIGISIPSDPPSQNNMSNFLNGVFIKKHYENKSLRIAFDNYSGSVKINGTKSFDSDTLNTRGAYSQYLFSVGAEKNFFNKKMIQIFYGGDLNLYTSNYRGQSSSLSGTTIFSSTKIDKGIGINLLLGTKITFADKLRLTLEISGNSIFFSRNEDIQYYSPSQLDQQQQSVNFVFLPNYISRLGLSYLF